MIRVSVFKNSADEIVSFELKGHAGYKDAGKDIICAATSILVINTINSVEQFTDDRFTTENDEKTGFIRFSFSGEPSRDSQILVRSMVSGLLSIEQEYGSKYIKILFKEV